MINDLVENRGLKVVVVTNDLKTIGDEFRDKLVWKHIHYKPDPGELALNLCGDIDNDIAGEKACSLISKAATTTQCRNARSIIKAKPLVEMFSVSNVLADPKRAASGRKDAFVEAVGYAFMKAMGNAPEPPQKTSDVQLADEKWLEHANKEIEYEHYRVIGIIDRYFDAGEFVSQEDVEASLAKFMDSRYPDSEGAARMIASMDKLNHITDFDEEEAERCVKEFSDAVGLQIITHAISRGSYLERRICAQSKLRARHQSRRCSKAVNALSIAMLTRHTRTFTLITPIGMATSLTKTSILLTSLIAIASKNIGKRALKWQNRLLTQALKSSLSG